MEADIVPMVVPPRPWVSVTDGGYLLTPGTIQGLSMHPPQKDLIHCGFSNETEGQALQFPI